MAARTVASKLAITRSSRVALLSGAIGIAAAGLIASPHILDAQLLAKKKPLHSVAAEPAPHFAGFAELVRAVKPAVILQMKHGVPTLVATIEPPESKSK